MALIDLSRVTTNISTSNPSKNFFYDEGAQAYRDLANTSERLSGIALDLYAKKQDIDTDNEANKALNAFRTEVAEESTRAIADRDPETGVVRSSNKSFEDHMLMFMKERNDFYRENMKESLSMDKFTPTASNWITEQNTANIFKNVELQKTDSSKVLAKQASEDSDFIRASSTLAIVANLDSALGKLPSKLSSFEKINGFYPAYQAGEATTKEYLKTAMAATIREAAIDPSATIPFAQLSGIATQFKTGKEYSTYVMQNLDGLSDEVLSKADEEKLRVSLEKDFNEYLTMEPHPKSNLWTPEEKDKNLRDFLANKFKNKKADQEGLKNYLNNWLATPQRQDFSFKNQIATHVQEFRNIMSQIDMEPAEKMETISKAINSFSEGIIRRNKISGDRYALSGSASQRQKLVSQYGSALLDASGLSAKEIEEAKKLYPSTVGASKDLIHFEDQWKKAEEKFNRDVSTPNGVWASINQDTVYKERLSKAFKVTNQGVVTDPVALSSAWGRAMLHFKSYGSAATQFAADSMFSDPIMSAVLDKLSISDPAYKRTFMEQVNAVSPVLLSAFTNQLAKKGETPTNLSLYRGMVFDSPVNTKRVQDNVLFINQKFGEKEIKDWIADKVTSGFFNSDVDGEATVKSLEKGIASSEYIRNLKEVALSIGLPEAEIKALIDANIIKKGALMEMYENPDTSLLKFHSTKVNDAINNTVKKVYNDLTPVNSSNLKTVVSGTPEEISNMEGKAQLLGKMIDQGLRNGTLKYDTQSLSKYDLSKLPAKQREWFERDTKNGSKFNEKNIALVGKSLDGSIGELTVMYKEDSSGKYRLLKLKDKDGKTFTPNINSLEDFKSGSVDNIFNKYIKR